MMAGTDPHGTEALDETSRRDPGRPGVPARRRHVGLSRVDAHDMSDTHSSKEAPF
jgi:hypothetical protein